MLVEITVSAETSKSVADVAINGPSKGVLDRSTPLDGGHIYSYSPPPPPRPLTQIPAKSAKTLPRPLFGYETLLT